MTTVQNTSSIEARARDHIICLAFAAIIVGSNCMNAIAQSVEMKPPQLYLTKDAVPKKGYIEEGLTNPDGTVAFRICATSQRIPVQRMNLTEIRGTCIEGCPQWCVARIVNVKPDGSVQIETLDHQNVDLTAEAWAKGLALQPHETAGFGIQSATPKVGDFVGGVVRNRPGGFYIMERRAGQTDIKG